MRTLAEIDADIADVQKRIAARNEGTPLRNSPEYRAARFDYIVDGDRSGLDAYQNALNAAIQNKLSRDAQERMLKAGKEQADDEQMDQWQKDYSFAKSAKEEIYNNPASTQKQKDDADATVRYYEAVGAKKGYMKKYSEMTKAPEAPKVETPAAAPALPAGESFKQLIAKGQTLETDEDLDKYIGDVMGYTGNDAVVREAYDAINAAQEKKKANADKRWATFKNDVDAAIKANDKKKLEELKGKLDGYDGQTDLPTVKQKVEAALKPKAKDPLTKEVVRKNFGPNDVVAIRKQIREGKEKGVTKPLSAGNKGRNVTFRELKNGNIQVLDENGKVIDIFTKKELEEWDMANTATPQPPKKANPVAGVLKGASQFPNGRVIVGPGEDW